MKEVFSIPLSAKSLSVKKTTRKSQIESVHEKKKPLNLNDTKKDLTSQYETSNVPQSLLVVGDTGKKYAFLTTRALKSL